MSLCGGTDRSGNAKVQILISFLAILKKYVHHEAKLKFIGTMNLLCRRDEEKDKTVKSACAVYTENILEAFLNLLFFLVGKFLVSHRLSCTFTGSFGRALEERRFK